MLTNSIKSNWTLEQLQWRLLPEGDLTKWDGLLSWFLHQAKADPAVLGNIYVKRWHTAASKIVHSNYSLWQIPLDHLIDRELLPRLYIAIIRCGSYSPRRAQYVLRRMKTPGAMRFAY